MTDFEQPSVRPNPTIEVYVKWKDAATYAESTQRFQGYNVRGGTDYTRLFTTPSEARDEYVTINDRAVKYIEVRKLGGNLR